MLNKIFFCCCFLSFSPFFSSFLLAQNEVSYRVNFKTNEYTLSKKNRQAISDFMSQNNPNNWNDIAQIELQGHTDDKGSDGYNTELSRKRVESVYTYLQEMGINSSLLQKDYYGETLPLLSNEDESGKAENRRVDIILTKKAVPIPVPIKKVATTLIPKKETPKPTPKETPKPLELDNTELNDLLSEEIGMETFKIPVNENYAHKTSDGTIFSFEADVFQTTCTDSLLMLYQPYNTEKAMIVGNMTTLSDKKLLYSVGMYDLTPYCDGKKVKLKNGMSYTVLLPATERNDNTRAFSGDRDLRTQRVNWTPTSNRNVENYSGRYWGNWGNGKTKKKCWLVTMFQSRETREKSKSLATQRANIKKKYKNVDFDKMRNLPDESIRYYVMQPKNMGLANCDIFWGEKEENLITLKVKINEAITNNTDVKLVFTKKRAVISPTTTYADGFEFRVPKGEAVSLVALQLNKEDKKKVKMAVKALNSSDKEANLVLENVASMKELDKRLAAVR